MAKKDKCSKCAVNAKEVYADVCYETEHTDYEGGCKEVTTGVGIYCEHCHRQVDDYDMYDLEVLALRDYEGVKNE